MDSLPKGLSIASIAVGHYGNRPPYGAVAPPLFQTAQFALGARYEYTRLANPTVEDLEHRVAALEGLPQCVAFASGMAALASVVRVLGRRGKIYVLGEGYAGTLRLLRSEAETGALDWIRIDADAIGLVHAPGFVFVESPTNPFLREFVFADLVSALPGGVGLVVDNTIATPVLQRPGEHGAFCVVHSASKFLAGHSDVIAGVVATGDERLAKELRGVRTSYGACLDPFAAWLCLRGIQTLHLRVARGSESAARIAAELNDHPGVSRVYYPGLRRASPLRQMAGGGAVVTFRLDPACMPGAFLEALHLVTPAASMGGVETLINQCATMSHASLHPEERAAWGLDEGVFRLSCGIEDSEEILDDLRSAIRAAMPRKAQC